MSEYNIRYLLKKDKKGKPPKEILQECVDGCWQDVPTILEERELEAEIERSKR